MNCDVWALGMLADSQIVYQTSARFQKAVGGHSKTPLLQEVGN